MEALGLIETLGLTTAVSAADAALKAADVRLVGVEKVIGVGGSLGVTIHLSGDVAAVTASVEAGKAEAARVGRVISAHVIAKAHSDVTDKIVSRYLMGADRFEATLPSEAAPASIPASTAAKPAKKHSNNPPPAPANPDDSSGTDGLDNKPN
ncbi:BMC domain-containing protein [Paenibacillus donghaensis]|uniref:BMC domain-containing protein n=1 Tax=Paenibacillus donghaensis TaxID=414771 RepID=A0A2Z2KL36_9BACL|nr:hypothetical protein B9T62_26990 [Paenibacillus donghaensis]